MKLKLSFMLFCSLVMVLAISSCQQKQEINPSEYTTPNTFKKGKGNNNGKGGGNNGSGNEEPTFEPGATYQLEQAFDYDPLYQFTFSASGNEVLFQTDPTVTSWGTDYWGYWSDPYSFANNSVNYIVGLSNVTYNFQALPGDKLDVTKILIVASYNGGPATTTYSHPGIYGLTN